MYPDTPMHALVRSTSSVSMRFQPPSPTNGVGGSTFIRAGTDGGDATVSDEDPRYALFRARAAAAETRLLAVLRGDRIPVRKRSAADMLGLAGASDSTLDPRNGAVAATVGAAATTTSTPSHDRARPAKRIAREIDEDDYGDDDDDDDDDDGEDENDDDSGPRGEATQNLAPALVPAVMRAPSPARRAVAMFSSAPSFPSPLSRLAAVADGPATADRRRDAERLRLQLESARKATEEEARRSCHTVYYTLETDRDALLEQQRLDELDQQIEKEMSAQAAASTSAAATCTSAAASAAAVSSLKTPAGSLSRANLGASNLTLKHLIARIDMSRHLVDANDSQLRSLISEVRKNRSKWASEDKIGQEELYEAAERVLIELKAQTEYASPFLTRVSKRDAPDYSTVIKTPMDIGTMLKRLKSLHYKSKAEFVEDLYLIWDNCLKYNRDPAHTLRKKAVHMKKQTDKLVRLIPDIVIRDRTDVEAEERRLARALAGPGDESDDEPIMASRGRKAPGKSRKYSAVDRKPATAPAGVKAEADGVDDRSIVTTPVLSAFGPAGTPAFAGIGMPSGTDSTGPGCGSELSDPDGTGSAHMADFQTGHLDDADIDDSEYNAWKQVTKHYRAALAANRHRLFAGSRLNVDEPALIRTRAGMRRWARGRLVAIRDPIFAGPGRPDGSPTADTATTSLAQKIEDEDETATPDYYDSVAGIPDLADRLRWDTDRSGHVIDQNEDCLRLVPRGHFVAPPTGLSRALDANLRRMQQTRKICAKIAIVRQMQVQSQTYHNQFERYDPEEFVEHDIEPLVLSDDGPVMSPVVVRATLQRSVAKLFYHAGFEEFQPSALDAVTDAAGHYFQNIVRTLKGYLEVPRVRADAPADRPGVAAIQKDRPRWRPRFSAEESVLQTLADSGVDVAGLESYAKDEFDRLGSKLDVTQQRMKAYYAELLRPAVDPLHGPDGVGAFADGSEQFLSGDFAEDIDEDFFGFRELGLDREFGLSFLSVPLHLLQNRLYQGYQSLHAGSAAVVGLVVETPDPYPAVTLENVVHEIGLVRDFFTQRLRSTKESGLVEDDDLPMKQRFPKPRLPPTGKITCPRKRPIREQQQLARKKKQMEIKEAAAAAAAAVGPGAGAAANPGGEDGPKIRFNLPASSGSSAPGNTAAPAAEPTATEKDDGDMVGMMSPESI